MSGWFPGFLGSWAPGLSEWIQKQPSCKVSRSNCPVNSGATLEGIGDTGSQGLMSDDPIYIRRAISPSVRG